MIVAVVGSGISGLSAAFYLAQDPEIDVTVYEQAAEIGGRANVVSDAEHCPRLFLEDYGYLFEVLRTVRDPDRRPLSDALRKVQRYCHTESFGWVEVSHLYRAFAREITLREKIKTLSARLRSPLLADQVEGPSVNRYSLGFSPRSLARIVANLRRVKDAYALDGRTDECLTTPWVEHLARRGVTFELGAEVERLRRRPGGMAVHFNGTAREYDAVVVTSLLPDAAALFQASGMECSFKKPNLWHCKCFTIGLDPREKILAHSGLKLYSRDGLILLVQPQARRCVVLCTRSPNIKDDFVQRRVRELLDLDCDFVDVGVRANQRPDEALFASNYVDPTKILTTKQPGIYFAGSYTKNTYPYDSAEGAVRSAFDAVRRLTSDYSRRECGRELLDFVPATT